MSHFFIHILVHVFMCVCYYVIRYMYLYVCIYAGLNKSILSYVCMRDTMCLWWLYRLRAITNYTNKTMHLVGRQWQNNLLLPNHNLSRDSRCIFIILLILFRSLLHYYHVSIISHVAS